MTLLFSVFTLEIFDFTHSGLPDVSDHRIISNLYTIHHYTKNLYFHSGFGRVVGTAQEHFENREKSAILVRLAALN